MQVLRLPPYPITITYDVPEALKIYELIIEEEDTKEILLQEMCNSTADKKINYTFKTDEWHMYDKVYPLSIKKLDTKIVSNKSLTSNVATLTTSSAHPLNVGQSVVVTGLDETFNGTHTITAKTSTTISYAKIATNVASTAVSLGTGIIREVLGDTVVEDALEIKRPYVDPNSLANTATEIAEYKKQEFLARSIIDAVLEDGFYYKKKTIEYVGLGTDYAPINYKSHKVLKVYQDNILHYDSSLATPAIFGITFKLSDNGTAVIKDLPGEEYNRSEQAPLFLPTAQSDWLGPIGYGNSFDNQSDFTFVLETGFKVVPLDIKEATLMLIDDIRCGKLDYYKRYVTTYNTDQFKLQFHKSILDGTGNLLVDKILSKYISDSRVKIGVL